MAKTKQLGKVEPELNKRITEYSKLIGISKTDLLEELFNKEVEDKVLDNSFIYPEEIYYFNFVDLLRFNTVKASTNTLVFSEFKFSFLTAKTFLISFIFSSFLSST